MLTASAPVAKEVGSRPFLYSKSEGETRMAWLMLALTIVFEVTGSVMMKLSAGFANLWPSVGVFVFYGMALAGLTIVLKTIELSVAYAIWSGAGTALTAIVGIWLFGETLSVAKVFCLGLIIVGVVGLQLTA